MTQIFAILIIAAGTMFGFFAAKSIIELIKQGDSRIVELAVCLILTVEVAVQILNTTVYVMEKLQ